MSTQAPFVGRERELDSIRAAFSDVRTTGGVTVSVISVAAHDGKDPFTYYYNTNPPVEFGAPGIDVEVAWNKGQYLVCTGNSFAAPHMTGITALIRAKHPELTPFQLKTVLLADRKSVV